MRDDAFQQVLEGFEAIFGGAPQAVTHCPYRLSPLGVHTDHQGCLTTGFTIDHGVTLAWRRKEEEAVTLASLDHGARPSRIDASDADGEGWARLFGGLWQVPVPAARGLEGVLLGDLPSGGIGSSAACLLAVAIALDEAHGVTRSPDERIAQVLEAERAATGTPIGILDPCVIVHGEREVLLVIDPEQGTVRRHRWPGRMPAIEWVLLDGDVPRILADSPYVDRVADCVVAAEKLGAPSGKGLSAISPEDHRRRRGELPTRLARRAEHVFSEHRRVKQMLKVLAAADRRGFANLVTASGDSLRTFFEVGTPETEHLLDLAKKTPGVLGANFAGGGFGGLVQLACEPGQGASAADAIIAAYVDRFPEHEEAAGARVVGWGGGPETRRLA